MLRLVYFKSKIPIRSIFITFVALWAMSLSSSGEVKCEPNTITFNSLDQEYSVKLMADGGAISGKTVKGWALIADGHTYNHMVSIKPEGDGIRIKPAQLEAGSYDLILYTSAGNGRINVLAPLDKLPDSIESKANQAGVDVRCMQKKMGLCTSAKRVDISIQIPAQYYIGQTLALKLDGNPENEYIWKVNDKVVKEGKGQMQFNYTFEKEGDYTIQVIEKEGNIVLGCASACTKVVPYQPNK